MTPTISKSVQKQIQMLLASNMAYDQVVKRIPGSKKSTLGRYANKVFPNRMKAAPGRRAAIRVITKSYIRRQVIKGEFKTAKAVHQYLNGLGYTIGYSEVLKLQKSMDFRAKIKAKKPLLSKQHKERRSAWAKTHKVWTTDDWRRMVFSDETKVNVFGSDGCTNHWSRPDDVLQPRHLDLTVKGGQGSVMVWGCITYDGPGYACWIHDGTMKAVDYVNILETTLMDSLKHYGYNHEDTYFQKDKDPKHTSKLAKQCFVDNNFKSDHIFSWPAQSPDLYSNEHVWHHLKLKLSVYDAKAKGVHELWERIENEWNTFTVGECRRYIHSMPDCCKAAINAKGLHTRY
ncbi:hypothetical protein G6F60_010266 [Rhizopus arrhizus]|nr:hypothetical protein G6F60_010266 [Rhizopus arrhizus]